MVNDADAIVKAYFNIHVWVSGQRNLPTLAPLADEYFTIERLSWFRAKEQIFQCNTGNWFWCSLIEKNKCRSAGYGKCCLNLFNNAFYSVMQKKKKNKRVMLMNQLFSVCTKKLDSKVEIHVRDNGVGISQNIKDKIFQPFFTISQQDPGNWIGFEFKIRYYKSTWRWNNSRDTRRGRCQFMIPVSGYKTNKIGR